MVAVSGFLFSCGDKMNKNTGSLEFDSIQVNETAHLFSDTARPACNLVIDFTYPVKASIPWINILYLPALVKNT